MTLILLAISLTIAACVIAWNLAIYALPVMAAITAAQYAWGAGAGVVMSGLMAIGAAESLVPVFVGFACLTVAWLLVAVGLWGLRRRDLAGG